VSNMNVKVQPRRVRTPTFVNAVAAAARKDGRLTIAELSVAFGVSFNTIHKTLNNNMRRSKKLAHWVPKFLNNAQKN